MKIEIQDNMNEKKAVTLLYKFIELNSAGYDYFSNDNIIIGYNGASGYSYIYLENAPHISICLDVYNNFKVIYSSGYDGIEFEHDLTYNSLEEIEEENSSLYDYEEEYRGEDYDNKEKTEALIEHFESKGWVQL